MRPEPQHPPIAPEGAPATPPPSPPPPAEAPSPLLGRWRNVYWLVIAELAVTIAFLYALTRWAS